MIFYGYVAKLEKSLSLYKDSRTSDNIKKEIVEYTQCEIQSYYGRTSDNIKIKIVEYTQYEN